MKCALASKCFINGDVQYNKNIIINTMIDYSNKADIVVFGESFLQGFDSLKFNSSSDLNIAISQNDVIIKEIQQISKDYNIAVSFGFIEKSDSKLYSSQITIDKNGEIINLFRRVSQGWKESFASEIYCEGTSFTPFIFMSKKIVVALCGDLWYEDNVNLIKTLKANVIFWPVYTDYSTNEWNTNAKYEYAEQAGKTESKVLYVNSYCKDKTANPLAKGGSALFIDGLIKHELPSGKEGVLIVCIE